MKTNLLKGIKALVFIVLSGLFVLPMNAADHNIWPERVTDMQTTWDSESECVTVTMTAPTHSMTSMGDGNGDPLPYLTKVVLSRNVNYGEYNEIYVFENPTPGEVLTYVDESAIAGLFQYKAVAYIDDYASYPEWSEILVGQIPADINDAYATCNKGEAPVTLIFTAPAKDASGEELKKLEKVEVCRYNHDTYEYELIGTMTEVYPGVMCTYDDADVVAGESYSYKLIPHTAAGHAYGTIVDVKVGLDAPVSPTNVSAEILPDGGVMILWMAPTKGQTNGYINPEEIVYTISRSATGSEYDADVLASRISDWYYVDETKYTDEAQLVYYVRAINGQGESVGGASNPIVVGNPSTLPYYETFDSMTDYGVVTSDHAGWMYSSSETSCAWYINNVVELEDRNIETRDGSGGMAFAMYGPYNEYERDDYMTSGMIALDGVDVFTIAFDYYAFVGSNSTLTIEVSADGAEYEEVGVVEYEGMPQEGWNRYAGLVKLYEDKRVKNIQVRLHAHKGLMSQPIIIDNFMVSPLMAVRNLHYDTAHTLVKWDAPLDCGLPVTGYCVSLNGFEMAILPSETTQYDYSRFKDEELLMFAVQAVYEGNNYSEGVILDMTSVVGVENDDVRVGAVDGVLYVTAPEDASVVVYLPDGTEVLRSRGSVKAELPSGVYIVKADRIVKKIVL